MTKQEKKIRQEWQEFISKNNKVVVRELPKEQIDSYFSQLFK